MLRKMLVPVLAAGLVTVVAAQQQPPPPQPSQPQSALQAGMIDTATNAKSRAEGMNNSQIMKTMHYLTDVYGPRLTGSPNHENAAKWAIDQMAEWGLGNGGLEPFELKAGPGRP